MFTSATVIVVSVIAAVLSCIVSVVKLVDWKRQSHRPKWTEYKRGQQCRDTLTHLPTRPAPAMAGKPTERVAHWVEVEHMIQSGDGGTFSGRSIVSYPIRFSTFSDKSHAFIIERDAAEKLWIIDQCEGRGVTRRSLHDEVMRFPGRAYWSRISWAYREHYNRTKALEAAHAMLGNKYGWLAVAFQFCIHQPVLRALAYFTRIDRCLLTKLPFCSGALAMWMRAGHIDPVPGRDPALVTPQDVNQSLAFEEWVALVP